MPDPAKLDSLVTAFFDGNKLQKENLRLYILNHLQAVQQDLEYFVANPVYTTFWYQVTDAGLSRKNIKWQLACQRIRNLPTHVKFWLKEAVSSPERFEFFVLTKAVEISSGDKERDYYHSLMVRHDQLLAVVLILEESSEHIKQCINLPLNKLFTSSHFLFFSEKDTDKRIYEKAEEFYQLRARMKLLS